MSNVPRHPRAVIAYFRVFLPEMAEDQMHQMSFAQLHIARMAAVSRMTEDQKAKAYDSLKDTLGLTNSASVASITPGCYDLAVIGSELWECISGLDTERPPHSVALACADSSGVWRAYCRTRRGVHNLIAWGNGNSAEDALMALAVNIKVGNWTIDKFRK